MLGRENARLQVTEIRVSTGTKLVCEFQNTSRFRIPGIAKEYVCKALSIPHKKPKKQELDATQKLENRIFAQERVKVEHAIGGMKRYRILSDRLRLHDIGLYNDVLEVCAGLWNFQLSR